MNGKIVFNATDRPCSTINIKRASSLKVAIGKVRLARKAAGFHAKQTTSGWMWARNTSIN